jgi:hypothetical protein
MSIDPKLEYTPEDDEAWLLFLKKFENLKLPPTPSTRKGNYENHRLAHQDDKYFYEKIWYH